MRTIKSYVFRTLRALRGEHGERTHLKSPGEEMGGQKLSVVLTRQALDLYCLLFCEHLQTPHHG